MGRYNGTLHKLIDNACASNTTVKWNQVLHYLEGHTVGNGKTPNPKFDSPLPPYTSPSVELELELFDQQGPKREDSPLKIAIKAAPASIVAALCHLGPEAAKIVDSRERLPIHWACRRSSEDPETEKVIMILAKCYPQGLVSRDDGGRTPLHWLFWYHAESRTSQIVKFMCQALPEKWLERIEQPEPPVGTEVEYPLPRVPIPDGKEIPFSAAIIPDARHGVLPLHYAVMQGANKETIKMLIQQHPRSISFCDRKGRTALAWYLGAEYLTDSTKHVCGETNDPNATPWFFVKLSAALIQLLVSSKVARRIDYLGRTALHWACLFFARSYHALNNNSGISVKAIQTIVDNNIQAVTARDCREKTPLHLLFDMFAALQEKDYKRMLSNRTIRDEINLFKGGPTAFNPPKELVELLLKSPEVDGQDGLRFDPARDERKASAAYAEDESAFLPLHAALRTAAAPSIIQLLVKFNPTSLVHTSEELLQTPLIHAFLSPFSAPLQTSQTFELLMAAYVTSRHGTFMDGRLALKMEDSTGKYPIHYACQNQACVETIKLFVEKFPRSALFQTVDGDLPLHCLLSQNNLFFSPENGIIEGATLASTKGLMTDKEKAWEKQMKKATKEKMRILVEPLISREHLRIRSSCHGMTPLHVVLAFDAVPYATIYRMLDTYPEAVRLNTTVPGYEFSCMDLHELHKSESEAENADQWQAVKELLFSFYPLLASHRQKEDMLDACVKLIRNEVLGTGSYHSQQLENENVKNPAQLEISETLSSIQAPEIDCAYRPQRHTNPNTPRRNKLPSVSPSHNQQSGFLSKSFSFAKNDKPKVEKSIYDADLDTGYTVSPQNSIDEGEDDEEFLSSEEEEEYFSEDDSSGSDTYEDGTSVEQSTRSASWDQGLSSGPSGTSIEKKSSKNSGSKSKTKVPSSPQYIEEKKEEVTKEENVTKTPEKIFTDLSDVAMRLWCFFVLFKDVKNPGDNYLRQLEAILEDLPFPVVQKLINFPVPEYAHEYLDQGTITDGVTLRDVASPCAKALFQSLTYFLGEYEFPTEKDGILLHCSSDKSTVYIRASRHIVSTQEYKPVEVLDPGAAEEAIWTTGEDIQEEGGYMASHYSDSKRTVYFKLTKNQGAHENEVGCRKALGLILGDTTPTHIVPLLDSFHATGESKKDKKYRMDINDERFQILHLYGGETISLDEYPYALVYPYCDDGDLFDYFYHHGFSGAKEVADVGRQVGRALKMMHGKGVVHGSLSMRSIAMLPLSNDDDEESSGRFWAVSDLSGACRLQAGSSFMGGISHNGSAQFETGLMPPEMFVKLSASEARIYMTYWEMVEKIYDIKVDRRVVDPFVNLETGSTYVLRCYYMPTEGKRGGSALPELPYELLPVRESTDLWCFGLLLFCLCSGGRPLLPANIKTGHLLGSEKLVRWDYKIASASVYEHIDDPVAQDILIRLLSPYDDRIKMDMDTILKHPFFMKNDGNSTALGKMIDHRQQESAVHDRWRQRIVSEKSEDEWIQSRTTKVKCWNFDLLRKFHFSSSEIVRLILGEKNASPAMPCGLLLLPYKLSAKNKKAKLAPTTKRDVERAERMGIMLLSLAKACSFVFFAKTAISESSEKQWTALKLLEAMKLPTGNFDLLKKELTKVAADHIEAFRSNPISVVHKVVESRLLGMKKFFKDASKAYLYIVDEHSGIPLVGTTSAPYPLMISDAGTLDELVLRILPFMHACTLYARGLSGSVSGLVRLIFEAAFPHIPPSWAQEANGLNHVLQEDEIVGEIKVLQTAISSISSSKANSLHDDLRYVRGTMLKSDTKGTFADMRRVECAEYALWTTKEGAAEIQAACRDFEFKDALEIQAALESKLKAQERQIKLLQEEIEKLSFRKELNLTVPTMHTYDIHSGQTASKSRSAPNHNSTGRFQSPPTASERNRPSASTSEPFKDKDTEVATKASTTTVSREHNGTGKETAWSSGTETPGPDENDTTGMEGEGLKPDNNDDDCKTSAKLTEEKMTFFTSSYVDVVKQKISLSTTASSLVSPVHKNATPRHDLSQERAIDNKDAVAATSEASTGAAEELSEDATISMSAGGNDSPEISQPNEKILQSTTVIHDAVVEIDQGETSQIIQQDEISAEDGMASDAGSEEDQPNHSSPDDDETMQAAADIDNQLSVD